MLQAFTTRGQSRSERSRQWRDATHSDHVEFEDDRPASARGGGFGPLTLLIVSMGKHRAAQSIPADQARTEPAIRFLFQEEGSATIKQGGRSNDIHSGQWCALRTDIAFTVEAADHSRQLCVTVPCALLAAPRKSVEWWRQPRSFLRGPAQILHASASASVMAGEGLSETDRDQIGAQLAVLAEMTVRAGDAGAAPNLREGKRRAIVDYIDRNLADAELSIGGIAQHFGWSSRTIHKLFEGEGKTVARIIWERRLERCREDMADPAMASRSLTEIAHLWGFADSQHFSRTFKQRFGVTPRDYRNLHAPL